MVDGAVVLPGARVDVDVVVAGTPVDMDVVVAGLRRLDPVGGGLALHVVLVLADVLALELRERQSRAGSGAQPGSRTLVLACSVSGSRA